MLIFDRSNCDRCSSIVQVEDFLVVVKLGSLGEHLGCLHGHLVLFVHLDLVSELLSVQSLGSDFAILDLLGFLFVFTLEVNFVLKVASAESLAQSFLFSQEAWSIVCRLVVKESVLVGRF